MKSTGIIRRIDDLGRIVIPKELRRTKNIHSEELMEIYVEDKKIIIKKRNKFKSLQDGINDLITYTEDNKLLFNKIKYDKILTALTNAKNTIETIASEENDESEK